MLTLFLALVLVLGFVTAFVWIPRLIDRRTESFQSDLVNRHYEEVENMYRTMRTWRHDYHNHIQASLAYLELGKYEELAAYLKKLDENLYEIDRIVKTGNLLDNAIEACRKVSREDNRFIKIYIDTLQEQFYISVMNGMEGRAIRRGELFQSTKNGPGLHGFGLQRVDRIVEKYGGFLDRQSEEGVFATEILLPVNFNSSN